MRKHDLKLDATNPANQLIGTQVVVVFPNIHMTLYILSGVISSPGTNGHSSHSHPGAHYSHLVAELGVLRVDVDSRRDRDARMSHDTVDGRNPAPPYMYETL